MSGLRWRSRRFRFQIRSRPRGRPRVGRRCRPAAPAPAEVVVVAPVVWLWGGSSTFESLHPAGSACPCYRSLADGRSDFRQVGRGRGVVGYGLVSRKSYVAPCLVWLDTTVEDASEQTESSGHHVAATPATTLEQLRYLACYCTSSSRACSTTEGRYHCQPGLVRNVASVGGGCKEWNRNR